MSPAAGSDDEGDERERVYGGRYELQRGIARGGMADVFLAHDRLLDRPVAVKVLFPELSSDRNFVERFRREAQSAANLAHPNIVGVYDWGEEADTYFIVMEYVDGRPLSEVIRSEGPLLADRAADVGADIAAALAAAHSKGVIHRDVKPSNVLLGPTGHVKVTDFGIARAISASEGLTQTGAVMGTATYFSPEQAQGHALDGRSDVYSLGVVLYEMVCGKPPFAGDSPVSVAYKHVKEDPAPPRDRNPDVPEDFQRIVMKALAKNPANRYQSADELRGDLQNFRAGRQVTAEPVLVPPAIDPTVAQAAYADATRAMPATAYPPAAAGPPAPNRSGVYIAVLVGLLGVLALVIFLLARMLGGDGTPATVNVPRVIGLTQNEAVTQLQDLGLEVETKFEPNDETPEGVVFGQNPEPGTKVDEGATVRVRISQGEAPVAVPSVVGFNVDDATDKLEGLGLVVEEIPMASDTEPVGKVLSQSPAAGQAVEKGTTVQLTVSTGKAKVAIPDVSTLTATEAANRLGQAGFLTREQQEASDTVPQGQVIRTNPPANTEVDKGSTVTIIVSSGPAQVEVPDVLDMTEADARQTLEGAGFVVVVEAQTVDDPTQDGIVIAQDPAGTTMAERGTTVTITVGSYSGI